MRPHKLKGIYVDRQHLFTKCLVGKQQVYGEKLVFVGKDVYRQWDPRRSKLCAGITRGTSQIGIKPGSTVLYLGCSTGTTVSHVSDIVGSDGRVYALDVAPRVMRELIFMSEKRMNIFPIMADAARPETFVHLLELVDVVFMDIAQPDQVAIFLRNCQAFLKKGGFGLLSFKSRSVDIRAKPKVLYAQARKEIESELTIVDYRTLDPFELDHAFYVCKK